MKSPQKITFVVDETIDIDNHFIALQAYKRNAERGFKHPKNERFEKWSSLETHEAIRSEIKKEISEYYSKGDYLLSLVQDINGVWVEIENDFIERLEKIHGHPFIFPHIKGVLSCAGKFGYNLEQNWFATDMLRNKYIAIDTATHELMHFMFHAYFENTCRNAGLAEHHIWDIKESFTVLLNLECSDLRFRTDMGYPPHASLREVIKKSWQEKPDFNRALERAIESCKLLTNK